MWDFSEIEKKAVEEYHRKLECLLREALLYCNYSIEQVLRDKGRFSLDKFSYTYNENIDWVLTDRHLNKSYLLFTQFTERTPSSIIKTIIPYKNKIYEHRISETEQQSSAGI